MANQFIIQKLKPSAIEFFRFLGGMRYKVLTPHNVGRYTMTAFIFEWKGREKPRLSSSSSGVLKEGAVRSISVCPGASLERCPRASSLHVWRQFRASLCRSATG